MQRYAMTALLAAGGLFAAEPALGAAWTLPSNVRVVQKAGGGGTNVLTSGNPDAGVLQSAINNATGCTAAAHCTVQVMPGVYDLGVTGLTMRPYVDLVGTGRESTVITSSVANPARDCSAGAVTMVNGSSLRNLKVVNVGSANDGYNNAVAFAPSTDPNPAARARVEDVTLVSGSATANGHLNYGACVGARHEATLDRVAIETRTGPDATDGGDVGQPRAVKTAGGTVNLKRATIDISSGALGWCSILNEETAASSGVQRFSEIEARIECPFGYGFFGGEGQVEVANSKVAFVASPPGGSVMPIYYGAAWRLTNVIFDVTDASVEYWVNDPAAVRIATSQLPGNPGANLPGATLVHDWNEFGTPIPNQP